MRILLLEDDADQAELLKQWMERAGFHCYVVHSAADMTATIKQDSFDLYILDKQLPESSGINVLREIREQHDMLAPILMVTQCDAEDDIVDALNMGADDYLIKPVREGELIARIKALYRRFIGFSGDASVIEHPPYKFNLKSRQVFMDDVEISLTNKEFDLAVFLFRNLGRVVSRSHMLQAVWGTSGRLTTRKVDTHISHLRQRLDINESKTWRLSSVYQQGYRLEKIEDEAVVET